MTGPDGPVAVCTRQVMFDCSLHFSDVRVSVDATGTFPIAAVASVPVMQAWVFEAQCRLFALVIMSQEYPWSYVDSFLVLKF